MKRALLAVNIALGAALAVVAALAAKEAVVLMYAKGTATKASPVAAALASAPDTRDLAAIAEGGLFGKATLAPAVEGAAAPASGLVLVGTAEGAGYAIFMDPATGVQKAFKVGDKVFGGAALASIATRQAELATGSGRVLLKVPSTATLEPARPAAAPGSRFVTKKGAGQWAIDQRAISGVFENMDRVLTDARFTPYIDGGALSGFKASEVKTNGVFGLIGLQDGDVVLSINGYRLDSPGKVAQVLGGLRGETEVKVDVLRGGEPRTLRYQIR